MNDDRGRQLDLAEKEKDPMGRFEILAERYMNGTKKERDIILSFFQDPDERRTLLEGFGLYHMFRDQRLYNSVKRALGEQLWKEFHPDPEHPKGKTEFRYVQLNYPEEAGPMETICVTYKQPVRNFTGFRDDPRVLAAVKDRDAGECVFLVWREVLKEDYDA